MIKIKSIYLSLALALAIIISSADMLFFRGGFSLGLVMVYIILLSLAPYTLHDIKIEKKEWASAYLFIAAVAAVSAAGYLFSFHDSRLLPYGIILMAAGLALIIIRAVSTHPAEAENDGLNMGRWREIAWLFVILALAFDIRIYRHDSIPPGVWFDEAQNGLETMAIIKGTPFQVFIPRLTMMPAMYFYIASFFTSILGANIFAIRLVSVIAGVLSVAAFYFFIRAVFKDVRLALAGAAMLAMSRWHITFSRVAFLGILTVLLELGCFYFYYKTLSKKSPLYALITGLVMGLSFYSFSAANFIPVILAVHSGILIIRRGRNFFRENLKNIALIFGVALVAATPLLTYALRNPEMFSRRMNEVSIMNEIKTEKSISPLVNSLKEHLLMFNYEGDYNGRHNLYKKPMVDFIAGALLAAGVFLTLAGSADIFYLIWFAAMLSAGILTLSIEAPQAYRTIAVIPCVYIFVLIALKEALRALKVINPSKILSTIFIIAVVSCAGAVNIYQYFVLYPAEKATYLSFSPEANAIAEFTKKNSGDYLIYSSTGKELYGFYPFEQKVICDFVNYGRDGYMYMTDDNMVDKKLLAGKKGIIALIRANDAVEKYLINKMYPAAVKKEFRNRVTDEVMFVCYYIDASMLKNKTDASKPMIFYTR
jgi:4-amino-4-deoxy-L-arabinose transferase-like glycosyltransferase